MWYNRLIINFTVATVTLFHHALLWYLWSGTSNSHLSRRKMSLLNLIRYPISPLSLSNASSVHQYVSSPPVGGLVVFLSARLTFCTVDSFWLLSVFPSIFLTLWCYFQRTANNLPTSSAEKLNQCNLLNGWPPIKSFNFSLTWELKTWQGCTGERIYTLIMWFVQERKKKPSLWFARQKKKTKKKRARVSFQVRLVTVCVLTVKLSSSDLWISLCCRAEGVFIFPLQVKWSRFNLLLCELWNATIPRVLISLSMIFHCKLKTGDCGVWTLVCHHNDIKLCFIKWLLTMLPSGWKVKVDSEEWKHIQVSKWTSNASGSRDGNSGSSQRVRSFVSSIRVDSFSCSSLPFFF